MSPGLERYREELARWGSRINLVGSTERSELQRHFDDSLVAADHLPEGARVVDLGSGAGFPGLPLAIERPDLEVVLVEIRERRVHFLRHVLRGLGLPNEVRRVRIEEAPDRGFDYVLLRAVAAPAESFCMAAPWAETGGEIWVWGNESPESLPFPAEAIPLERGSILRARASVVPRGTR